MELKALLSFMNDDEKAATVNAYKTLFERFGSEREQELIEALDSPVRQVLKLEKSYRGGKLREVLAETVSQFTKMAENAESLLSDPESADASEPETVLGEGKDGSDTHSSSENESETEKEAAAPKSVIPKVEEFPQWGNNTPKDKKPSKGTGGKANPVKAPAKVPSGKAPVKATPKNGKKPRVVKEAASPTGGSVTAAVVVTPFLVVIAAVVLLLTLLVVAVPGAFSALCAVVGRYFSLYSLSSMSYMPDLLMVLGLGVVFLGLAFGLLGVVVRLFAGGLKLDYELLSSTYGKLLGKGTAQDE